MTIRLTPAYRAALVLVVTALVLMAVAVLTGRNDLLSAALVLAALTCLLAGIFLSLLSTGDPVDSRYTSLLAVPGAISLARVAADLGVMGNALVIPKGVHGMSRTMQFLPVAGYDGSPLPPGTFVATDTAAGLLTLPAGSHLLRRLETEADLAVRGDLPVLRELIREVGVEVMEVADRITVSEEYQLMTVTMEGYRFSAGCRAMVEESLKCCTTSPCPVCSLFACILAEGTGKVVKLERCSPGAQERSVVAVFSILS